MMWFLLSCFLKKICFIFMLKFLGIHVSGNSPWTKLPLVYFLPLYSKVPCYCQGMGFCSR